MMQYILLLTFVATVLSQPSTSNLRGNTDALVGDLSQNFTMGANEFNDIYV